MTVDDFTISSHYRLSKIMNLIESLFGETINFSAAKDLNELVLIYEEYGKVRQRIIKESKFNSYANDPIYTKACLIQEAIKLFLSEVAPKRRKRSSKGAR